MTEYMCFRCNYKTKYRGSMKNHFNKKKKCERSINSLHQWKFKTPILK